ncbi:MAG: sensor histidine kinase [Planctomycetota bacterium]
MAADAGTEVLGPLTSTLLAFAGGCVLGAIAVHVAHRRRIAALERALQQRDEHLARTAHELRTPLTAMMSSLEIVRDGHAGTPEEAGTFLAEADLAGRHLSLLINDVVDQAACAVGHLRLELREHRIGELLRDALRMLGMQAARNPLVLRLNDHDECTVRADARRTLQVLFNLVGNAVKHSEPGDAIEIDVVANGPELSVRVLDRGTGVPDAVRAHLFEPFAGDDQRARADSTGLGLYICRSIVEQMGGAIGFRPRDGRGSEFWFSLPQVLQPTIASARPLSQ